VTFELSVQVFVTIDKDKDERLSVTDLKLLTDEVPNSINCYFLTFSQRS